MFRILLSLALIGVVACDGGPPVETDTDSDTDTDVAGISVFGAGAPIPPGSDFFEFTADGITPYSFSIHSLRITNHTGSAITLDSIEALAPQGGYEDTWQVFDYTVQEPIDVSGVVINDGDSYDFRLYFNPIESGPATDDVVITYDSGTFEFTVTGRGRDAFSLFNEGVNVDEKLLGDPDADLLAGAMVLDASDNMYFTGNANEWSDGFSENLSVSKQNADGSLAWSKEWSEDYTQASFDPGQNGETGGSAGSIALGGDKIYTVFERSQSSYNSRFQTVVAKIDTTTGAMDWASAFAPANVDPPSLGWQNSAGYAVDASISDRVLVVGNSLDSAEVLLYAINKTDGSLIWAKQLDIVSGSNDRGYAVVADGSGNAWLGGLTNGRGFIARVNGVDGATPTLEFVKKVDMGTGSNVNDLALDASGNCYASLDRRGVDTHFSVAKFSTDGSLAWAKTWNGNEGQKNNTHVVQVDDDKLYVGGRIAIDTADTQFGEAFILRLGLDGTYDWATYYYTGKGAEEVMEHRTKGIAVDSSGDLRILLHSYAVSFNYDHYWGFWYNAPNDPLADLTLGEDPGLGEANLVDYLPTITDVTSSSDLHDSSGSNGSNVATIFMIETTSIWQDKPAAVTYGPLKPHEGNGVDGDAVLMHLDLN